MADQLEIGDKINNYEILKILGASDLATVYLAKDNVQHRKWIVKEMRDPVEGEEALQEFKENFVATCRQLSGLKHKALVQIIDFFVKDDKYYIVREFLEGRTLQDLVDTTSDNLTGGQVRIWAQQIFNIIQFLHSQSPPILMGVIVPKNLILSPMGKLRIMDLGLARFFPLEKQKEILLKVSPGYTAPEILNRNAPPDERSEVYCIAALLHHFLTKQDPNKTPFGFKKISEFRTDISETAQNAIMKALSKDPSDRFENISEFGEALLGHSFRKEQTKIESTAKEIILEDAPAGQLVPGEFEIKNVGKGQLEGVVFAKYSWLKINPERFRRTNLLKIKFWIDTAYMEPDSTQENTITIQTEDEKVEIPVTVSLSPVFPYNLKTVPASIIMFLMSSISFILVEAFRNYQIDQAWNRLLIKYNLLGKGIKHVVDNQQFLLKKMDYGNNVLFTGKLYAFFMILLPYVIPVVVGKLRQRLKLQVRKATTIPAAFFMILPSILLVVANNLKFMQDEILLNPTLKYLRLDHYMWLFIPVNIIMTAVMLAPRDEDDRTFIDKSSFLRILTFALIIIYFVLAIIFKALM